MSFLARSTKVGPRSSGGVTQTGFSSEIVQRFIGPFCAVTVLVHAYDAAVTALETGFAGFSETSFA